MLMDGQMKTISVEDKLWVLNVLESELEKVIGFNVVEDVLECTGVLPKQQKKRVDIQTLGTFEVFIDKQLVEFKDAKAKELFAICVNRKGAAVEMQEAVEKIWKEHPDSEHRKNCYQKAVAYIHALMMEHKVPDVFVSGYGNCQIIKEAVSCDFWEEEMVTVKK